MDRNCFGVLTFSTGLLAFSAPGMLDLMATIDDTGNIPFGWTVYSKTKTTMEHSSNSIYDLYDMANYRIELYFICKLWISCHIKIQLSSVIMLFASAAVRDKEIFLKAGLIARIVAIVSIGFSFIPLIGYLVPGVFWYGTARSIHYISICIFSLALYYHGGKEKKDLLLCILFMIPCILWVFRTSIMGTALA